MNRIAILAFALFLFGSTTKAQLSNLKFDVELELDNVVISNIKDWDHTEDIFGTIDFYSLKALSRVYDPLAGTSMYGSSNSISYPTGTYPIDKRIPLIKNLTLNELKNIELTVGGAIWDDEGLLTPIKFFCADCANTGTTTSNRGERTLKFIELTSTVNAINNLQNNGTFQDLKFGDDKFFELNFYENRVKANGWLKFKWKVWVKPHA